MSQPIKILVVEDEAIIGMDIRNTLQRLGYQVPPVIASGEKAIRKATELEPDLILMDIMLKKGGIDGVEAAQIIHQELNLPIVYLTAHTDLNTLERAKATKPFGYIVKPFEEKDLYTTIEIALARSKAEAEIQKTLKKEQELNELKSRFVSMVSHEFKTPLSTILFSIALLEEYGHTLSELKKNNHFQRIRQAIKKMNYLLENVLSLVRSDTGEQAFNPQQINLNKFCQELVEEMQIKSPDHLLIFEHHSLIEKAEIDEQLLWHILNNLISNAIKYSPAKSPIKIKLTSQLDQAIIIISDQGIGIPQVDQNRLFEMFHRGKNVGHISGSGLGLAIVKRSIELHHGEILLESIEGQGTTVTVKLPIQSPTV